MWIWGCYGVAAHIWRYCSHGVAECNGLKYWYSSVGYSDCICLLSIVSIFLNLFDQSNQFEPKSEDCDHCQIIMKLSLVRSQSAWHSSGDLTTCLAISIHLNLKRTTMTLCKQNRRYCYQAHNQHDIVSVILIAIFSASIALLPRGTPFGDLFQILGSHWVPISRSPFSLF